MDNKENTTAQVNQALSVASFKAKISGDTIIVDTRQPEDFMQAFIPGSIFIGFEKIAEWAGTLLTNKEILLVAAPGTEKQVTELLTRIGFDKIQGYLDGGFESWKKAGERTDMIIDVDADELAMDIPHDTNLQVVDVRRAVEFAEGHVKDAINMPLNDMTDLALIAGFEENQNLYIHSGEGYRSIIACSLLKAQGLHNLRNVNGGWLHIKEEKRIKTMKDPGLLN